MLKDKSNESQNEILYRHVMGSDNANNSHEIIHLPSARSQRGIIPRRLFYRPEFTKEVCR